MAGRGVILRRGYTESGPLSDGNYAVRPAILLLERRVRLRGRRPGCVEVDRGARLARVRSGPDGVEDVIGIDRVEYGWELYAPDAATRDNPYVSPLRASTEELKGLPPALVITAERSVARRRRSLCTQAQRGWRCGDRHPL